MVEAEKKTKLMVKSEKVEFDKATQNIYRKLMVTNDMVEYVLDKYRKNYKVEDEIFDVILEDLHIKYRKDDKGMGKVEGDLENQAEQAGDAIFVFTSLDLENRVTKLEGDLARANQSEQAEHAGDDVNIFASLDLEKRVTNLEEDFARLVKAKKAKEPKEVPKVIKVSTGQDVACFNDVNYPLKIRMLKETPRR
ncbi:hypothetical protein Tco_1003173 [Tanacetum coccineum]|uniref:Uncharacterized protein n=1 Tax=Tanacetum coccineum TaxID=301880 RepID=A0ABQ5F9P6_9ASTR